MNESMMQFLVDGMPGILSNIPYYIFWKDMQSVYLGCNRKFSGLLNKTPEDIIGKTDYELGWREGEADIFIQGDKEAMQGTSKIDIEETLLLSDGAYLTLLTSKIPLFDASGACCGVLGVCIDISRQKKIETQLRLSKEAAETANLVKTEFIANMSHDIRTPLSGVVGISKILENGAHTVEEMQYAHWLNESGEQLLRLLNGIVDVLSTESDQKIKNEKCNLRECINNLVQLERPSIKLKNLELSVLIDEQIPEFVLTDQTKLHRILLNLLGNAIKFTHTGYVAIKLGLVQQKDNLVTIKFSVSDSGEGIPEASQANVFERFFQEETSSEKHQGRGMGLHIAQSYVRLLGGEIKLMSRINEGSTFYFELPMERAATDYSRSEKVNVMDNLAPSTHQPKILLVEDNFIARHFMEILIKKTGCHVVMVDTGEEALAMIQQEPFDLLITDIGLPGMTGVELTTAIRVWEKTAAVPSLPIVGLTGYTSKTEHQQFIQAGMNKILCKPADPEIIQSTLKELVFNQRAAMAESGVGAASNS